VTSDDAVAGRQGRPQLPAEQAERIVPGRDRADDPDWIAGRPTFMSWNVAVKSLAHRHFCECGEIIGVARKGTRGAAHFRNRLAVLAHLQSGELLVGGIDRVGEPPQQHSSLRGRHGAPLRKGALRRIDGAIDIGRTGERNLAPGFVLVGIVAGEAAPVGRLHPFAVDQHCEPRVRSIFREPFAVGRVREECHFRSLC
jgi:hypothetical protein